MFYVRCAAGYRKTKKAKKTQFKNIFIEDIPKEQCGIEFCLGQTLNVLAPKMITKAQSQYCGQQSFLAK